jgi:hypothetical protein
METRIDDATKAVITILEGIERRNPGKRITKENLFPIIISRVEDNINDSDLLIYDEEAISAPDESFLSRRWPDICKRAAQQYKKYIVWSWEGIRLGTLEEYQDNQKDLKKIILGGKDCVDDRTKIIRANGGRSFTMIIQFKNMLPSGEEIDDES